MRGQRLLPGGKGRPTLLGVILLGFAARVLPYPGHPTYDRTLTPWRESDWIQVARALFREATGMDKGR